jgi:hypothetical protein
VIPWKERLRRNLDGEEVYYEALNLFGGIKGLNYKIDYDIEENEVEPYQ